MTLAVKDPTATEQPDPKAPAKEETASAAPQAQATQTETVGEVVEDIEALRSERADLQRKLETAEKKRIPDLQGKVAKVEQALAQREGDLRDLDARWWSFIEAEASAGHYSADRLKDLRDQRSRRGREETATRAEQSEGQAIALQLFREDEKDFATFLSDLIEAGNVVTRQNLPSYRSMFERYEPRKADEETATTAPKAKKEPPKVPTAPSAGPTTTKPEPAWKPGTKPAGLLGKAFASVSRSR